MTKRIYLAGSFDNDIDWRNDFSIKLANKFGNKVIGINQFHRKVEESNPKIKIGHDMFCVKNSDLIVVNAIKSKITMGTAQEIILAKYWNKPVIMVIDENSGIKFKERISPTGILIKNYIHPFADNFCDAITDDYDKAIELIHDFLSGKKTIKSFKDTLLPGEIYEKEIFPTDSITQKFFKRVK
jgi:nucleoside 2-deoxyribosyltransferase